LNAGQIFSTYLDNPRKNAWRSLTAVVKNVLGYFKAPNYYNLSKTIEKIRGMLEYQHVVRLLLGLRKRLLAVTTPEKHRKDNFWISNRAIFSVMNKEYAIMFGLFFAF